LWAISANLPAVSPARIATRRRAAVTRQENARRKPAAAVFSYSVQYWRLPQGR
jgi:hypothetical protein